MREPPVRRASPAETAPVPARGARTGPGATAMHRGAVLRDRVAKPQSSVQPEEVLAVWLRKERRSETAHRVCGSHATAHARRGAARNVQRHRELVKHHRCCLEPVAWYPELQCDTPEHAHAWPT
eukprot:2061120-Rhodomonas_salina.2